MCLLPLGLMLVGNGGGMGSRIEGVERVVAVAAVAAAAVIAWKGGRGRGTRSTRRSTHARRSSGRRSTRKSTRRSTKQAHHKYAHCWSGGVVVTVRAFVAAPRFLSVLHMYCLARYADVSRMGFSLSFSACAWIQFAPRTRAPLREQGACICTLMHTSTRARHRPVLSPRVGFAGSPPLPCLL